MNSEKVTIEIWSDIVCPFCFVGKKKLEKAIKQLNAQDQVEVIWHSFQLDPDFPENQSIPSTPYLSERKGYPEAQVKGMCEQLTIQGKPYGINFNFDQALTFNTLDAHRLIQWSKTLNKSNELKEALMEAYFTKGIDLSKPKNLINIVKTVSLDSIKAKEVLDSDLFAAEVQKDIYQSRQLGVRGVPYFLINENLTISGAQSDEVFQSVLTSALKNVTRNAKESSEGVCSPEAGDC